MRTTPYDAVAAELASKYVNPGLWAQAIAEADGDEAKAKASYIRHRATQIQAQWIKEEAEKNAALREAEKNVRKRELSKVASNISYLFQWLLLFAVIIFGVVAILKKL